MRLIGFLPEHLGRMRIGAASMPPRPGVAFTLMDGDRVMGCAGLVPMGRHAEAWAVLSDELRSRPMLLHRLVMRALRMQDEHWPTRLLAVAQRDSRAAQNWLERLGFRQINRDADWVCYERVNETAGSIDDDDV